MDFLKIGVKSLKKGHDQVYADFIVKRTKDLMIRGKSFYAIWIEEENRWSTDEYDVQRLVDAELSAYAEKYKNMTDNIVSIRTLSNFSTGAWTEFKKYMQMMGDNSHELDCTLTFQNTETSRKDYVSKRLPYELKAGDIRAYEKIMNVLYVPDERRKIEWAIGSIISGDARSIQKFLVFYGPAGTGKSTVIEIIQKLFDGYYTTFDAKALTSTNNTFSTEAFKFNPLVAIQHDGDLSKIEDNTKLNSIVSHEKMSVRELYKPSYTTRINAFLFMATNKPVKITDAKSGVIRRLIDTKPTGNLLKPNEYHTLMSQVEFELGAIAFHCLETYRSMGKSYYSEYVPFEMMEETDVFFNFIEDSYHLFREQDGITLKQAYDMYKEYCDDTLIQFKLPRYKFKSDLKDYFENYTDMTRVDGVQVRNYYSGFLKDKIMKRSQKVNKHDEPVITIDMSETKSLLDDLYRDAKAQYASSQETPIMKWAEVTSTLKDLSTTRLHYLKLPKNHIVVDFDLKDHKGDKSLQRNLEAASKWPATYAEYSKSGKGIHLHYIYDGNVDQLKNLYDTDIEIKIFKGGSALRRKLTKCNNIPIQIISSGLPLKGEKVINFEGVQNEQHIRRLIEKNLRKESHPSTKSSIDFINKILDDAYNSGMVYDVTNMRPKIMAFANNSTNQSMACVKIVSNMKFKSEDKEVLETTIEADGEIAFFDVEVFPNLFICCYKFIGQPVVKMINPSARQIMQLFKLKLVGFNCKRYDNHIIYGAYIGYNNAQLYDLSQKIIAGSRNAMFREAYNISYTDIYDFSSKKQSLKKFEIELGIHHQELGLPWDQPVPEDKWELVADYCCNDVIATEVTFNDRAQDFIARQILSELSGLSLNDSTQNHTARIMFGDDPRPQDKFNYVDLSEEFEGYKFENGKSTYRGEDPSEGGYVYAEPHIYGNVALLDVASMHPTTITYLNFFGPYTARYAALVESRLAIKAGNFDKVITMLDGIFKKYLSTKEAADQLAYALKIHALNIVYGLTAAKFDNKFRHPKNIDNIIAKRPALFMIDLKHAVQEKGFTVAHIKTDSIKIPDATPEIIEFVMEFGKKYGYTFEHEATYDKMCLVNDAVYVAKYASAKFCQEMYGYIPGKNRKEENQWTATGAEFAHPYLFKKLFSKEPIEFHDLCETKSVTSSLYLDVNEDLPDGEHNYVFVGKIGEFCPMKPGANGGILYREKDGKYNAATGSKGYRWMEAENVKKLNKEDMIDYSYFDSMVAQAKKHINDYGDFDWFVSDIPYDRYENEIMPF